MLERIKDFVLDNVGLLVITFVIFVGLSFVEVLSISETEEHCLDVYRESGYILNSCKEYEDKLLELDREDK